MKENRREDVRGGREERRGRGEERRKGRRKGDAYEER